MSRQETAEIVALQAFAWLAANDELLPVFLGSTGASLDDLARSARSVEFLASVLDFLLMDDEWIIACCDAQGLPYEALRDARAGLPGAEQHHWT